VEATERRLGRGRQAVCAADDPHANSGACERVAFASRDASDERQERADFRLPATPVLLGKGEDRQDRDAVGKGRGDRLLERAYAAPMTRERTEALGVGPAPITVHDDGNVLRNRNERCDGAR